MQLIDRVALVTLTRAEALNALSTSLLADLNRAFAQVHALGSQIGCIVLTGAGRAFAAGADIKEMVNNVVRITWEVMRVICNRNRNVQRH